MFEEMDTGDEMLELSIIHDPGDISGQVNLGRILEAMLYYDRVHLMMNAGTFSKLWALLGPDDFAALLKHPTLTVTLTSEVLGIQNQERAAITTQRPVMFKLSGKDGKVTLHDKDDVGSLLQMVERSPRGATWAQVNKLVKRTKLSRYSKMLGSAQQHQARFVALAKDPETLKLFVRGYALANGMRINEAAMMAAEISVTEVEGWLWISSSVPLPTMVEGWNPESNWGNILPQIQEYAIELFFSDAHSADIVSRPEISEVASARVDLSLQRAVKRDEQISAFQELAFEDAHVFADAFNEGLLSLAEALTIIDKSRRFRTWTRGLAPDANLIAEYHKAVTKDTALGSLPASIARFAFFGSLGTTADAVAPGTGLIPSVIDTFIVDRVFRGWRPNVFVRNVRREIDKARTRAWNREKD